jgi:hypothetical protein
MTTASSGSTSHERGRGPGTTVALRDGSRVLVRPVRRDDREPLLAGFAKLSEADVTYLTEVDHHDHEALAALDPGTIEIEAELPEAGAGRDLRTFLGHAARARASSSSRNASASACGSGTSPASVRKPTVTFPA